MVLLLPIDQVRVIRSIIRSARPSGNILFSDPIRPLIRSAAPTLLPRHRDGFKYLTPKRYVWPPEIGERAASSTTCTHGARARPWSHSASPVPPHELTCHYSLDTCVDPEMTETLLKQPTQFFSWCLKFWHWKEDDVRTTQLQLASRPSHPRPH